jgi:hypothetical protein
MASLIDVHAPLQTTHPGPVPESEIIESALLLRTPSGHRIVPDMQNIQAGRPILRTVPGPRLDLHIRDGTQPPDCLALLGELLASLHAAPAPRTDAVQVETPPWDALSVTMWRGLSTAQRRLVGKLHGNASLRARGRATRTALASGSVWCHGDARTNNAVVTPEGIPLLIDWENSGEGRPETDLAALCSAILSDILNTSTAPVGISARRSLEGAISRARNCVSDFLDGYYAHHFLEIDNELLAMAVGCGLLSRAFMRGAFVGQDRIATALEQIGCSLLLDPHRWEAFHASSR